MARLIPLLALARQSDRRWSSAARSGTERAVEMLFGAGCAFAIYRQVRLMVSGLPSERLAAERLLFFCLCAAWVVVPLGIQPSIPPSSLALYPLTRRQRMLYLLTCYVQKPRLLAVCGVSLLAVAAELWLPFPLHHASAALAGFTLSAVVGLSLGIALKRLQSRDRTVISRTRPSSRPFPFVRKELAYFSRTLDPYLALIVSGAAGYSEYLAGWLTPLKLLIPLLLIALLQSSAVLNPFALDTAQERERYKLFPLPLQQVVFQKHVALAVIFACTTAPLAAMLAYRMTFSGFCTSTLMIVVVLISWLCSGVLLMSTPSAQRVRMTFGSLSGEGMSVTLAFGQAVLVCLVPAMASLVRVVFPQGVVPALVSALVLLTVLYAARLRSFRD